MTKAKESLLMLEKIGKYVFHGTDKDITELTPRQAHNYNGIDQTPDSIPAVYASSSVDYAIFMAIITEENCPNGYWSSAGTVEGILKFSATQATIDQLQDTSKGWVYVFDKKDFVQRDSDDVEFVTYQTIRPIQRIQVSKIDLPSGVTVK